MNLVKLLLALFIPVAILAQVFPPVSGGGGGGATIAATPNVLLGDNAGNGIASGISPTTAGFLDPTSSVQTQLNGKQASLGFTPENTANKDAASGYAGLTAGSLLKVAEMPALTGDCTTAAGAVSVTCGTGIARTNTINNFVAGINGKKGVYKRLVVASDAYYNSIINGVQIAKNQLVTYNGNQYLAYYNLSLVPQFIKRNLSTNAITKYATSLPAASSDDPHLVISVAFDTAGFIHLAYGCHNSQLHYYKSNASENPSAFTSGTPMVYNTGETLATYPIFVTNPVNGELYFTYRTGGSGQGDQYFYHYNVGTTSWEIAAGTGANGLMIWVNTVASGGPYSSYLNGLPKFDSNGVMWFSYSYSKGGAYSINQYILGWNGTSFVNFTGSAQTIPVTFANLSPVLTVASSLNQNEQNDFSIDAVGVFHVPYCHIDSNSVTQVYVAESSTGVFVERQLTFNTANNSTGAVTSPVSLYSNGYTYVVYPDVFGKETGTVAWQSSDHFISSRKFYTSYLYNPGWAINIDVLHFLDTGIASYAFLDADDNQGVLYMLQQSTNVDRGNIYIIDWVPSLDNGFTSGLPTDYYGANVIGALNLYGANIYSPNLIGTQSITALSGSSTTTPPLTITNNGTVTTALLFNGSGAKKAAINTDSGTGMVLEGTLAITKNGAVSIPFSATSGYFINFKTAVPQYVMNSTGSGFGQLNNVNSTTWALGYGTSATAIGTNILTWNQSFEVSTTLGSRFGCTHGSNGTCGIATLSEGTATIATTAVTALAAAGGSGAGIYLNLQSCSTCGTLSVGTVNPGTSFVINSTNVLDSSNVFWELIKIN